MAEQSDAIRANEEAEATGARDPAAIMDKDPASLGKTLDRTAPFKNEGTPQARLKDENDEGARCAHLKDVEEEEDDEEDPCRACSKVDGKEDSCEARLTEVWRRVPEELHFLLQLAGPMVVMNFIMYARQLVIFAFVGQMGPVQLAGCALSLTAANVTGYAVVWGMSLALEPLMGAAYGSKSYLQMGEHLQRGCTVMCTVCLPIAALWWYMEAVLLGLGQQANLSAVAGQYMRYLLPDLFLSALVVPTRIYLRTQLRTLNIMACNIIAIVVQIVIAYVLVVRQGYGAAGAATAAWIFSFVLITLLWGYIRISDLYRRSWPGLSLKAAFTGWWPIFRLGVPSAFAFSLMWWYFEFLTLLSGFLPSPEKTVSAMSICLNVQTALGSIPIAVGGAASTRIGTLLGAGEIEHARITTHIYLIIAFIAGSIMSVFYYFGNGLIASLFVFDPETLDLTKALLLYVAAYALMDGPQQVSQGVLRGTQRPHIAALINLFLVYPLGFLPAYMLAFRYGMGVRGLWSGVLFAEVFLVTAMLTTVFRTDWPLVAFNAWKLSSVAEMRRTGGATTSYTRQPLLPANRKPDLDSLAARLLAEQQESV